MQQWKLQNIRDAQANQCTTSILGRHRLLPHIDHKLFKHRKHSERAGINHKIQGSAADVIRRAMVAIPPALSIVGLGAKMLLQVHDELIFDVPEGEVEETTALVKKVMEGAAHLSIPLIVDAGIGDSWAEAH